MTRQTSRTARRLTALLLGAVAVAGLAQVPVAEAATDGFAKRTSTSGTGVVDSTGLRWDAESGLAGGTRKSLLSSTAISGTADPALYRTYRFGVSSYTLTVPRAATYDVTLRMVEPYWRAAGKRVFDVTAEGTTVLTGVDVHAAAGRNAAHDRTVRVQVTDGRLDLGFRARVDKPIVSAIAVVEVPTSTAAPAPAAPAPVGHTWRSGAACTGTADGTFAAWRGRDLDVISTWADNNEAMVHLWQLQPGAELGNWNGDLDIALGALGSGETWKAAAAGAYDTRWRASLTNLARVRADEAGTTYIRFAHEMNGNWYPWSVNATNAADFVAGWKRFRALQRELFPTAKLVFNVNRESVGNGIDWRTTFPGRSFVDVLSVDYYNMWPYVSTQAQWDASVLETDRHGAPKGLRRHAEFAAAQGLPLAVSEWSNVADHGDSPLFVEQMREFFAANGGNGPGEVLYESLFNCRGADGMYQLYPTNTLPASSAAYRDAF